MRPAEDTGLGKAGRGTSGKRWGLNVCQGFGWFFFFNLFFSFLFFFFGFGCLDLILGPKESLEGCEQGWHDLNCNFNHRSFHLLGEQMTGRVRVEAGRQL